MITLEPDRGAGFMSFAPRVMLNQADVARTGLVQPASRVSYRFAVAGDDARGQDLQRLGRRGRSRRASCAARALESFESGRPEMRQTLDRAEKFLNLVALLAALLSAVAVALAARGFAASHLDDCAMLRVLGQSQRTIAQAYAFEFAADRPVRQRARRGHRLRACTTSSSLLLGGPGRDRAARRRPSGRWPSAWAWGSRCCSPSGCRRCCSWRRCRRCA